MRRSAHENIREAEQICLGHVDRKTEENIVMKLNDTTDGRSKLRWTDVIMQRHEGDRSTERSTSGTE